LKKWLPGGNFPANLEQFLNNQARRGEVKGMDSLKRTAIILELIERMKEQGSWCGETHIQKCSYFLQEMMAVPMGFDFI